MKSWYSTALLCTACSWYSVSCWAAAPPMPPLTSGSGDNGMKHALVSVTGTVVGVHISEPPTDVAPAAPVVMTSGHGVDFDPAKFDVLEGLYFNAQYGWLPASALMLPADRAIWIERTSASQPAGSEFRVYEGGMGMTNDALMEGPAYWTMNEIYAADGDRWQWNGRMQHDYYAADMPGDYAMSFRVYVGDASGAEDLTYAPATTTLQFRVVPEPATWLLAAAVAAVSLACRRRARLAALHSCQGG